MDKKQTKALLFAGMGVALAAALGYALFAGTGGESGGPAEGTQQLTSIVALPSSGSQTRIDLSGTGGTVTGSGAAVSGNRVTISQAGEYLVSGSLQGQLWVEAGSEDTVVLRLAGAEIISDADAAIQVENAGETLIWLEEGTENLIQSGTAPAEGVLSAADDESASGGAVYARDDLTLAGEGSLRVLGYLNNGIQTSNDLTISGGNIAVEAVNNGLKGKDSVTVTGGVLDIRAGGDGVKSDDATGEGYGVIAVSGGELSIESTGDAVQAETALEVTGGSLSIVTGGGSGDTDFSGGDGWGGPDSDWDLESESQTSSKGLKSGTALTISGGVVTADCRDDAVHSNGDISITGGALSLASGDDGIHADGALSIEDGSVTVTRSYEGLEGNLVYLRGGEIDVTASDDGVNAYGGQGQMGGRGGWGQSGKTTDTMPELTITGGTIAVDAGGDGLDSNGNITIEGGTTVINGPSGSGNGALDYGAESGGTCAVSGGVILALGSNGMAESFGQESTQCSFRHGFESGFGAGDEIVILDAGGGELFRHTAVKSGGSVVFSAPQLAQGKTYTLKAGSQTAEITLDSVSTVSGAGGFGGFGGGRGDHGGFGGQRPEGMPEPPDGQPPEPPEGMPERRGGRQRPAEETQQPAT